MDVERIIKGLSVTQICVLGIVGIWFFLTVLLLVFCIYANRQSRRETELGGRMARGHYSLSVGGVGRGEGDIEVQRVQEPFMRRVAEPGMGRSGRGQEGIGVVREAGKKVLADLDKGIGRDVGGIRQPTRAHHSATQRGGGGGRGVLAQTGGREGAGSGSLEDDRERQKGVRSGSRSKEEKKRPRR